jgi:microcompartment protein CcmK/EutM
MESPAPALLVAVTASARAKVKSCSSCKEAPLGLAADDKNAPVDAVVIGIVDTVDVAKRILYKAQ